MPIKAGLEPVLPIQDVRSLSLGKVTSKLRLEIQERGLLRSSATTAATLSLQDDICLISFNSHEIRSLATKVECFLVILQWPLSTLT